MSWFNFFSGFESTIYTPRNRTIRVEKLFELKNSEVRKDSQIFEQPNPQSHLKRKFDEINWLNMNLKPDRRG
jgi:hypothetical protein